MSDLDTLNIELPERKILRLGRLNSGDILIGVEQRADIHSKPTEVTYLIIPENRRDIIANFIKL